MGTSHCHSPIDPCAAHVGPLPQGRGKVGVVNSLGLPFPLGHSANDSQASGGERAWRSLMT